MGVDFNQSNYQGCCHCGSVTFTVTLADGLNTARRCDCSFCRMRGAVAVTALHGDIKVTKGEDHLKLYQFNQHIAEHYFCNICGIYTFHRRRSDPGQWGVNVACLEGVSPFDFDRVEVNNGQVHPSDVGPGEVYNHVAGVLHFKKSE